MASLKYKFKLLKFRYQKLVRGYSDHDIKNLYYHIAEISLPLLEALSKKSKYVYAKYTPENYKHVVTVNGDLDKMILAFKTIIRADNRLFHDSSFGEYRTNKEMKDINKGLKLFTEKYRDLWC